MSGFRNPYGCEVNLSACGCPAHTPDTTSSVGNRDAVSCSTDAEVLNQRFVESALVRALLPHDETRRRFMRAVGANTAMAAIGSVFPVGALAAMAQDKAPLEKKDLKIGFIPITCATPLIMAGPFHFYEQEGLKVT